MTRDVLPPASSPLGTWVRERLRDESIGWLVTVDDRGIAQPNPVWFLWDGTSILVYNLAQARRLHHIRRRPAVTFHLDSHGRDGDAVVFVGTARVVTGEPPADEHPAFREKYDERMDMTWRSGRERSPWRCASSRRRSVAFTTRVLTAAECAEGGRQSVGA